MMRWIALLAVLIVTAVGAHWATLAYAPNIIMNRAISTLKNRGIAEHAFTTPQRITPQTQAVVRSSPDLFYSLCRYDLSQPSSRLIITMAEWPDYQSLSFFDDETNNFQTLRGTGRSVKVGLHKVGEERRAVSDFSDGWVQTPSDRGVILIRRLAPTPELFAAAQEAAKADSCKYYAEIMND